jgi:hypothetical protein
VSSMVSIPPVCTSAKYSVLGTQTFTVILWFIFNQQIMIFSDCTRNIYIQWKVSLMLSIRSDPIKAVKDVFGQILHVFYPAGNVNHGINGIQLFFIFKMNMSDDICNN